LSAPRRALPTPPPAATMSTLVLVEGRRPVKRLSQSEMEECCRLRLFFNCNEKFGRSHNRVCQRIFVLNLADDGDDDTEPQELCDKSPHILLHAIAEVCTSETMQVRISLGNIALLALLDSGSTHNFISEHAASRTTMQLHDGERFPTSGVYRAAPCIIGNDVFTADFFALPLAGYDIILGTQWLASLGPILWDFGALTMSF